MPVNRLPTTEPAVLIIGAGPVGLTAAIELARRHIPLRIIDAQPEPASTSRALGMHARTLETFGHLGVLDAVLAVAQPVNRFAVFERGVRQTTFSFDFSGLGYRLDHSAFLGQAQTEALLRARLAELGVTIEWGCELVSFSQNETAIQAVLRDGNGTHPVLVSWLIGADGGHSRVRKQLGLSFDGASDETWLVADAVLERAAVPANAIVMNRHPEGNLLLFPFPATGRWRILETNVPAAGISLDQIRNSFERRLRVTLGQPMLQITQITWSSRFTIQQRQAERLHVGRCFLVGDAAHVHSPASGQGMNTGIQDAFNLGWKLALVIDGTADTQLLDSYERERRPVSTALLRSAQLATRLIQSRRGLLYQLFGWLTGLEAQIAPLHRRIERNITRGMAALSIRYGDAPADLSDPTGMRFLSLPTALWRTPAAAALLDWVHGPAVKVLLSGPDAPALASSLQEHVGATLDLAVLGTGAAGMTSLPDPAGSLRTVLGGTGHTTAWIIRPDGYLLGRYANASATQIAGILRTQLHLIMAEEAQSSTHS